MTPLTPAQRKRLAAFAREVNAALKAARQRLGRKHPAVVVAAALADGFVGVYERLIRGLVRI